MSFLTSTFMVETGLWDAVKTRTQKFGKSFWQGCVRYGEARARAAMKMHKLGNFSKQFIILFQKAITLENIAVH
jgi:hypothetical protein